VVAARESDEAGPGDALRELLAGLHWHDEVPVDVQHERRYAQRGPVMGEVLGRACWIGGGPRESREYRGWVTAKDGRTSE
jgi:hypothetical protein